MLKFNLFFVISALFLAACTAETDSALSDETKIRAVENADNNEAPLSIALSPEEIKKFLATPTVSYKLETPELDIYLPFQYKPHYTNAWGYYSSHVELNFGYRNITNLLLNIELENSMPANFFASPNLSSNISNAVNSNHRPGDRRNHVANLAIIKTDNPDTISIEKVLDSINEENKPSGIYHNNPKTIYFHDADSIIFDDEFSGKAEIISVLYIKYLTEQNSILLYYADVDCSNSNYSNRETCFNYALNNLRIAKNLTIKSSQKKPTWNNYWNSLSTVEKESLLFSLDQMKQLDTLKIHEHNIYRFNTSNDNTLFSLSTNLNDVIAVTQAMRKLSNKNPLSVAKTFPTQNYMTHHMLSNNESAKLTLIPNIKTGFKVSHKDFYLIEYTVFHHTQINHVPVLLFSGCNFVSAPLSENYCAGITNKEMIPFYARFFENIHEFLEQDTK